MEGGCGGEGVVQKFIGDWARPRVTAHKQGKDHREADKVHTVDNAHQLEELNPIHMQACIHCLSDSIHCFVLVPELD